MLLPTAPNKPHCVYYHKFGSQVFYIGSGQGHRPFTFERRGVLWQHFVQTNHVEFVDIEIVAWFKTRKEARHFEEVKIARLKPAGNSFHNPERYLLMSNMAQQKHILTA